MGRDRQDRTTEEWATFGHHLLDMMGKKHKLYKEISGLITKLTVPADDINKDAVTHTLNSHKYELKSLWRKWTQKIKQTPKDKERTKFYIKKSTFENILNFTCLSPELKLKKGISDEAVFEILFTNLKNLGIKNTNDIIKLNNKLIKYAGATSDRFSKDNLTSEIKDDQDKNNIIIHAILNTLKGKGITTFEKLRNIKNIIKNKEISELERDNEILKSKIKALMKKVTELQDKLEPH